MDHEAGREVEPAGGLGVTERAAAELPAGLEQPGAGGPVDGAVDAAPTEERRVGRVDDGVDVLGGDVAEHDLEMGPTRRSVGSRTEALQGPSARTPGWARAPAAPDAKKKPLALGPTNRA